MVQYTRETLYEEVWNEPVSTVAKKYGVSDVAIHKICKSMDIPVPPRGYWAKKRAGQKVQKTPLPKTDKRSTITRYFSIDRKPPKPEPQLMDILPEEEYKALYKVAGEIEIQPEGTRYHKTITAFKSMADTWKKDYGKLEHYRCENRLTPINMKMAGIRASSENQVMPCFRSRIRQTIHTIQPTLPGRS